MTTENVNAALPTDYLNKVADRILDALQKATLGYGFNIIRGEEGVRRADRHLYFPKPNPSIFWCADTKNIDVCGALAIVYQHDTITVRDAARAALNVTDEFMHGLVHGWDMEDPSINDSMENCFSPLYIQAYWLGANISKGFIKSYDNETGE